MDTATSKVLAFAGSFRVVGLRPASRAGAPVPTCRSVGRGPGFSNGAWRLVLLLLTGLLGLGGSCHGPPGPRPGIPEYQQVGLVPAPGGLVNVAGNNLLVHRTDLSIDTRLGTHDLGATYNAAGNAWLWSFDISYDGETFVDPSGAELDATGLAPGQAIPGTHWVVLDGSTLRTKGGLVHEFHGDARLAAVRWASADWPRLVFVSEPVAGAPRTTRIEQCTAASACIVVFDIGYDAAGRVVSIADRAGRLAEFSWDAEGRLATARDGLDTAKGWPGFRYEYTGGRLSAVTSSEGERVEYRFDGARLEIESIGGEHPLHVFRHAGRTEGLYVTEHTDPEGHVTAYHWDGQRRLHAVQSLDTGERVDLAWSGLRPVARVLPDGATTTWTWAGDDVATETRPSGNVVRFAYAPQAVDRADPRRRPVERVEDDLGLVEERGYDAQGRLVSVTNGAGETTTLSYGPDEMLARRTDPAGVVTAFSQYGEHGHPLRIARAGQTGVRLYDDVGNLLESRDAGIQPGGVARRGYDADRNPSEIQLRRSVSGVQGPLETLVVEHRSDGRPRRILRPHGDDAELVYDDLGRLVERRERVDGAWRTTRFEHDALGRVVAVQRPNGMRQETTYDPLGRIATRTIGRGDPLAVESTATFTYEDGRRVEVLDSVHGAPERIGYDHAGRPGAIAYPGGEVLQLAYDARDRVTSATLWALDHGLARTVELVYDGAGREVGVVDAGEEVLARVYEAGRLAETRYGNGLVRTYGYDAEGALARAETVDAEGAVVESSEVSNGFFTNPATVNHTVSTPGGLIPTTVELYDFDVEQTTRPRAGIRLQASLDAAGNPREWDYDALGNVIRTSALGVYDHAHVYNAEHNRLLAIGEVHTYAYDAAGYATERDGVPLAWDGAGRIAAIGAEATFAWDTLGRPVSSTVLGVTRTLRFGGLVEADAAGTPLRLGLGEVKVDLVTDGHRYRHLDFRGNVSFVTDDAGRVVAQYRYTAFGLAAVVGDPDQGPSFARGRALDDLVLLGHRILDRDAARFLAPDPIYQLVNQYAYAYGNPIHFWDPSGLHSRAVPPSAVVQALLGIGVTLVATSIPMLPVPATQPLGVGVGLTGVAFIAAGISLDAIQRLDWVGGLRGTGGAGGGSPDPDPGPGGGSSDDDGGDSGDGIQIKMIELRVASPEVPARPPLTCVHCADGLANGGSFSCSPSSLPGELVPARVRWTLVLANLLLGLGVAMHGRRRALPTPHGARGRRRGGHRRDSCGGAT